MKRNKRIIAILVMVGLVLSLTACGGNQEANDKGKSAAGSTEKSDAASKDAVHVKFWYSMGGANMDILENMIKKYNSSQDKIVVEGSYQGGYEDALNKLKTVADTKEAPTMMQVYDGGTLFMKNSGFIVPVQNFIDKEKYDTSSLEPGICSYYTDYEGKLNSIPFNSSEPILYYNKDMFKAAGLDPENPPTTLEDIASCAQKLTVKDGKNTKVYGFTMMIHAWFFEQIMANSGQLYVDNDNGRKDFPAKAVFNNEIGSKMFKWLYDMYRDGSATSYGRGWDEFRTAFQSQQVAMCFDSSANLAAAIKNASFEVGTARMPVPNGVEPQGCPVGGASIYIIKGASEEEQQAAWEFMKYLVTPEIQAEWHVNTGYFPVNKKSYELQIVKDNLQKYPQFSAPINQVQSTKVSPATQGVLALNMDAMRDQVNICIEGMFENKLTPEKAIEQAIAGVNQVLDKDKQMVGK